MIARSDPCGEEDPAGEKERIWKLIKHHVYGFQMLIMGVVERGLNLIFHSGRYAHDNAGVHLTSKVAEWGTTEAVQ